MKKKNKNKKKENEKIVIINYIRTKFEINNFLSFSWFDCYWTCGVER